MTKTTIHVMTQQHPRWEATIRCAETCSWRAGPQLADKMRRKDFAENERVLCAEIDGKIAGFCTVAEKDELPEGYDFTPFIGFVFVEEGFRGHRLSEKLIRTALSWAGRNGWEKIYLMSGEIGLYEKYGFVKLGDYRTVYGSTDQLFVRDTREE